MIHDYHKIVGNKDKTRILRLKNEQSRFVYFYLTMDSSKVTLRINHNFPISLQSIDLSTETLWVVQLEILEVS